MDPGRTQKQPGFTIVGFKRAHDCAYRQKESASSEKKEEALIYLDELLLVGFALHALNNRIQRRMLAAETNSFFKQNTSYTWFYTYQYIRSFY